MNFNLDKIGELFLKGGLVLLVFSLLLLIFIFYPVIREEIKFVFPEKESSYKISEQQAKIKNKEDEEIFPVNEEFGLIIPKIKANERIIKNVNPFDENEYQKALKKGIAHAKETGLPGEDNNIFLFAHSSGNFYQNNRLNTVFLLLNKLEKNDQIIVFFEGEIFEYQVFGKKIVDEKQIEYMNSSSDQETITLMTCWPLGTSYKRLLVFGKKL
jgi:sortase A